MYFEIVGVIIVFVLLGKYLEVVFKGKVLEVIKKLMGFVLKIVVVV